MKIGNKFLLKRKLDKKIKACHKCFGLNIQGATENAPGYGNVDSSIVLVGQSLCLRGIKTQIPFSGGCGILLDKIFQKAGMKKEDVFITNVVHCHPQNNRPSKKEEIESCRLFLEKEIEIIRPKIVICLGKDAIRWFLGEVEIKNALYQEIPWKKILLYPVYHPSYIMKQNRRTREYFKNRLAAIIKKYIRKI